MAMTYDAFLDQMKKDLEAGFAEDLPAKYSQVKIGIRDVEKLQGESYRGISFRVGDAPIEGNLNMQQAYQAHEAGVPYESILRDTQEAIMQQVDRMPQFNIGEISDYESMKANLMMELIPQKGNEGRLAEVLHQKVEDMALIYRMDMGDSPGGKVRMDDFGFIGMTEPQYDPNRCVSCEQCIKYCNIRSVGALSLVNGKVVRDADKCIGCGVCVAYCPTRAWTRSKEHYFRVVIMGRTGKKNPRLAEDFVKWADEESIFKMVRNAYAYVEEYIDPNALEGKEHIGYIVDRTGFDEFCKWILKDVHLGEKAEVASRVYWGGKHYDRSNNLM